ncbi:hypothetical protein [Deinococcus pimensis]|uniref:hypothetical protein n=1 Tax=Deinococcus pimensis TaxID=309888 RepID=UPI000489E1C6|nr:hypothetical protein [Deinococcus pimensis]
MSPVGRYREPRISVIAAYAGSERRSDDRVAELSRELDSVCLHAASALEVAVTLELLGYTDDFARRRCGVRDLFDLAAALYEVSLPGRRRRRERRAGFVPRWAQAARAWWARRQESGFAPVRQEA